jgi:hypothetical protein
MTEAAHLVTREGGAAIQPLPEGGVLLRLLWLATSRIRKITRR